MIRKILVYAIAKRLILGLLNITSMMVMASAVLFGDSLLVPLFEVFEAAPEKVIGTILRTAFSWA